MVLPGIAPGPPHLAPTVLHWATEVVKKTKPINGNKECFMRVIYDSYDTVPLIKYIFYERNGELDFTVAAAVITGIGIKN